MKDLGGGGGGGGGEVDEPVGACRFTGMIDPA